MNVPASVLVSYSQRSGRLLLGLFLYALGSFLTIQANIGLAPWEAFGMGFARVGGISFGNAVVLSGFVIVVAAYLLNEKIGVGTLLNAVLIGTFVDLIQSAELIPAMANVATGIAMLVVGQFVICLGSYFYIGAGLGCGPRDSLMVAISRRFPRTPIGAIRGMIEGSALVTGWLLGAKVGLGTVISVLGIGFSLQLTFRFLKFDVRQVKHDSIGATARALRVGWSAVR
ncbi:MAG TPA: hypothetical protein DCS43_16575 [Verrucomicrobia bacterium]|nr:hypothetical protein [Verrucomicrobiota bacterium]